MIIRAWVEIGSAEPLRAHLRVTSDISTGIEHSVTLVRSDAVHQALDDWLEELLPTAESGTRL